MNIDQTRSDYLALASHKCTFCHGVGTTLGKRGKLLICNCVYRAIFRACHDRFVVCSEKEKHMTQSRISETRGGGRKLLWGRKDEEYVADFCLISRRYLSPEDHKVFKYFFLYGADWKLCARQLGIDRGLLFHAVTRIQQRLGRVFSELKPYALYPLDDYFHGALRLGPECISSTVIRGKAANIGTPLRPPLPKAA